MGPLEVDLFASRLTHQLPQFFSLKPDPLAIATDAFLQDWGPLKGYANPPWGLLMQSPITSTGANGRPVTSLESSDMVPYTVGYADQLPSPDPSNRQPDGAGTSRGGGAWI